LQLPTALFYEIKPIIKTSADKSTMTEKESAMDQQRTYCISNLMVAVCFVFAIFATSPVMAEYTNVSVTDTNDPAYWLDRGGLYATYGSYKAAIKAYEKALALDSNNSIAYFNRGLAYAELGDLEQARMDINKAISLDASKRNYYYGRGRVHLMSGNKDQAIQDFKKAANMGDLDAISYLQGQP
jgi:tetratricopeptide (TPR) repeat protein